jgi:hypothetical protein
MRKTKEPRHATTRPVFKGGGEGELQITISGVNVGKLAKAVRSFHDLAGARAPHLSTRAVVETEGGIGPRTLYTAWDDYNRLYFDGKLAAPLILITFTCPRALADHQDTDKNSLRSVIRIHPHTMAKGLAFACDVLLHEMVHVWQGEVLDDLEDGYAGHGPKFAERCNAIGARLGLPEVWTKGRRGKPSCAKWPINVRPEGYYGTDAAEAERQKRAAKPKEEPAPSTSDASADGDPGDERSREGYDASAIATAALVCMREAELAEDDLERETLREASALLSRRSHAGSSRADER